MTRKMAENTRTGKWQKIHARKNAERKMPERKMPERKMILKKKFIPQRAFLGALDLLYWV